MRHDHGFSSTVTAIGAMVVLVVTGLLAGHLIASTTYVVYSTGAPTDVPAFTKARITPSAAPATTASTQEGELWWDSTAHSLKVWSGSEWASVASSTVSSEEMPVGSIIPYAGTTVPTDCLECDGSLVSTTTYATLYAVVGTTWGSGEGTFGVPDLRGRAPIGAGTGSGLTARALAATGGEETHSMTEAEMGAHYHLCTTNTAGASTNAGASQNRSMPANTGVSNSKGSGTAHNTMMPWAAVKFAIRFQE